MDEELSKFVDHARSKGMDHTTIRQLLTSAGWKDSAIAEVFCARDLEMPIPAPPNIVSPPVARRTAGSVWPRRARDAFLHLLMFGSLYSWATSAILLFLTYIDFAIPDPAWRISFAQLQSMLSIIRAQLAIVIVAFPVYLVLWHYLLGEAKRNPGKSGIRRWLGYLSIFVGALTLSGDLITLIYFALEGQLTVRLLLKGGTLFLIAGGLVLYLALTLRSEKQAEEEK